MCGIAGLWRFNGPEATDVERIAGMSQHLLHRGPDDFGYLAAEGAAGTDSVTRDRAELAGGKLLLASRRLSIIDLSPAGRQPIANEAEDTFVVFNGAIYNYRELRTELEALGHQFRSNTDTEVIVHAYEAWGVECCRRFIGMWAYAIWDGPRRQLVLSRDRFGIKPLFLARTPGLLLFASEMPVLARAMESPVQPDLGVFATYLRGQRLPAGGRTAFAGIDEFPPAHNAVVLPDGTMTARRYWNYTDRSERYDAGDPAGTARSLLSDSVRLQLRADVPTGILLSGGADSSSVAALAAPLTDEPLRAFTCIFPGFWADEQQYAETVAQRWGLPHELVEYRPDHLVADLTRVIAHEGNPPMHTQVLAQSAVLEAASRHVKVVLGGQGSDEIMGGYVHRNVSPYLLDLAESARPWNVRATAADAVTFLKRFPAARQHFLTHGPARRLVRMRTRRRSRPLPGLLGPAVYAEPSASSPRLAEPRLRGRLNRQLWRDHSQAYLPDLLAFDDSVAMTHSIETRLPFTDHRLVEFMLSLPFDAKIKGARFKRTLFEAMGDDLPEAIRRRRKIGFMTPLGTWLRPLLESELRPYLLSERVLSTGLFEADALRARLDVASTQPEGPRGQGYADLFRALAAALWFDLFVHGCR